MESPRIYEDHFPRLESRGKQQRSWKVMENKHNVMEQLKQKLQELKNSG